MKWFYNLKIAQKLIMAFITVAFIAGVVGVVGIINVEKINNLDTNLYQYQTATMPDLTSIANSYQRERSLLRDLMIVKDSGKRQDSINKFKSLDEEINASMSHFEKGIQNPDVLKNFNDLKKVMDSFEQFRDKEVSLITTNQEQQAIDGLYTEGTTIADKVESSIDNLTNLKTDLAKQSSDNNSALASKTITTMILVIAFGVIMAIGLGLFISKIISAPVKKMVEAANKLALGDINVNVEADSKDEIGSLAESFGRMIENIRGQALAAERMASGDLNFEVSVKSENDLLGKKLSQMIERNNDVLSNISNAAEQVASGSKQISDSSIALSQGATEQASSIEELTASLEEIYSQTHLNAKNANKANELAEAAKLNAIQGDNQMKEMLKAMEEINEASGNISKIIKVIDDIAFQTNILALNAAVEAARAGQHGKGFAVVAEEVRNLAARSANAAKETTDMIEDSIKKSEGGTKIASDTACALNEIVNAVENVANLVSDIAIASNEQSTGLSQINQGIMEVSQVVQSNSATSEEGAAASEELSTQAVLLKEMVSKFELKKNVKSYNALNELNPEVLKMLDEMSEKKKHQTSYSNDGYKENESVKSKIILSDKEFGKY
ncbi:methyl-accepting chemotaxis protein [Clostridium saccharobutylicum]|uniref:methyl-accepting chemotaxis protein n=1 Tax=Clostridium saccharobutylicum TaxID=169679 RepID=UPI001494876D|nr:HAMP domain-containing methyl-accepting chemotaxis protein [Clostridium saccharobutylicum]NOW65071.1 methyl-accepting chemotaxis protein [Clostridium saccharobutylicum]